jgi:chromosome segregation ATPase
MSETRSVVTSESLMQQLTGTPAPEAKTPEQPAGDEKKGAENTPEGQQQPKKKPLVEELVRTRHERNEARTEADQLRAELEELRQQMQANQAMPAPKEMDPKPERSQFVSDGDYLEALTDWKTDQKLAERQQAEQQARVEATQQQLADNWAKRLEAAKTDLADFDEVVGKSEIDLPNHLYVAIVESDMGPQLAYYLAQNPSEARLLKGMSQTAALRMLGKLEDQLEKASAKPDEQPATGAEKKPEPAVEKSKAPPPIEPLTGASGPVEKPTSQMTYAEYKAYRQAQIKARNGR